MTIFLYETPRAAKSNWRRAGLRRCYHERIDELHKGWMKEPAYRTEYEALEGEFTLAAALIRARRCRFDAGAARRAHGDEAGSRGAMGRRQGDAVNANADTACESDRVGRITFTSRIGLVAAAPLIVSFHAPYEDAIHPCSWYRSGNRSKIERSRRRTIALEGVSRKRIEVGDKAWPLLLRRFAGNLGRLDRDQGGDRLSVPGDRHELASDDRIDKIR
jgi:hypothetical protein